MKRDILLKTGSKKYLPVFIYWLRMERIWNVLRIAIERIWNKLGTEMYMIKNSGIRGRKRDI